MLTRTIASTRPARTVSVGIVLLILVSGCIGGTPDCAALPSEIDLTLTAESLTPSDPGTCRGTDLTLTVHARVDGILHIHGYDAEVPATAVTDGADTVLAFTAARSGQFPIELHTDDDTQGVTVGLLTVHEP